MMNVSSVCPTVKHSLKFFITTSNGVPNIPESEVSVLVDELEVLHCNTVRKSVETKQEWMKLFLCNNPDRLKEYTGECFEVLPHILKDRLNNIIQRLHQRGAAHTLQWMRGCEWDEETEKVTGFNQYGYDGEDFMSLDFETLTWVAQKSEALSTKRIWDADEGRIKRIENFCTYTCPDWLKEYVKYGKSTLLRTVHPSVSLLQKTPSSPVSCHATGFYPHEAKMFWTKDGEELREDVTRGEILPNHDETFQMSVDLNISSVRPEDRWRYECLFQLSGSENNTVTKLDRAVIRTNW
ncbi:hypothetical protein INR49_031293, partial [Caranx melampygus]